MVAHEVIATTCGELTQAGAGLPPRVDREIIPATHPPELDSPALPDHSAERDAIFCAPLQGRNRCSLGRGCCLRCVARFRHGCARVEHRPLAGRCHPGLAGCWQCLRSTPTGPGCHRRYPPLTHRAGRAGGNLGCCRSHRHAQSGALGHPHRSTNRHAGAHGHDRHPPVERGGCCSDRWPVRGARPSLGGRWFAPSRVTG